MKILIGTPIHECKDYCMEKWLENVSKSKYPADLLIVDNSPSPKYVEKVRGYCKKYAIKNYTIKHIVINQNVGANVRIEASQEVIRQYVLSRDYDAWFSWECDQILPTNALTVMIKLMRCGDFMMVNHNSWSRWNPDVSNTDMGCTLVNKECLSKYWIYFELNGKLNFEVPESYEFMFKEGVLGSGGNYAEVYGIINPIYHLKE